MPVSLIRRAVLGFVAGALAVLTFHQGVVAALYAAGIIPRAPYSLMPTPPLEVPAVLSAAFFGGLWGVVMLLCLRSAFPRGRRLWLVGLVFGAVLPTAVGMLIVTPLKGQPIVWDLERIALGLLINGAWGLGTILIAQLLSSRTARAAATR